jgi:hypothetical protein
MSEEHTHSHDQVAADATPDTQIDVQRLITKFGNEIGALRGQAIVDAEVAEARLEQAREGYVAIIQQLEARIQVLESQLPKEGASQPSTPSEPSKPSKSAPAKKATANRAIGDKGATG